MAVSEEKPMSNVAARILKSMSSTKISFPNMREYEYNKCNITPVITLHYMTNEILQMQLRVLVS